MVPEEYGIGETELNKALRNYRTKQPGGLRHYKRGSPGTKTTVLISVKDLEAWISEHYGVEEHQLT